jgi:hypothetical protein
MFNGGKNGKNGSPLEQRGRIGTSYLAYDCSSNIVCVAAHLDASFLKANPSVQVEKDDGESWIRFGEDNGSPKLKESNADEFMYVGKPDDSSFIIGYEGCWSVDSISGMESVVNNFVEVHFSNDGDTTSSGKPASNGEFICLSPFCEPTRPSLSATPFERPSFSSTPVASPSMNPTGKPISLPDPTSQPVSRPSTTSSVTPTYAPVKRLSYDQCCPEDNGFCPAGGHTLPISLLDLSPGGTNRPSMDGKIDRSGDGIGDSPIIDGWTGEHLNDGWDGVEYNQFTELPMFNGGKNGVGGSPLSYSGRIGTAYIAYDCSSSIVCAAAHLNADFLDMNPQAMLQMNDSESWIRFGPDGATKLKESNADEFSYVTHPETSSIIGWESCWSVDSISGMESITNNFVEVHFSLWEGQTTSTGKPAADGEYFCLKPQCEEPVVPDRISSRGLRGTI